MNNRIWIVRAPNGEIIGAAADRAYGDGPYNAICTAFGPYSELDIARVLIRAVENDALERYEADGYTLALETLMPREAREGEG